MPEDELPDWTTDMDEEILEILNSEMILTPGVIAENIDRSSGAVSRRLNALEAGELVKKQGRGKYKITDKALRMFDGGFQPVLSEEEKEEARKNEKKRRKKIQEELGLTEREYLREVEEEYNRLKEESSRNTEDLLAEAFEIVEKRNEQKNGE